MAKEGIEIELTAEMMKTKEAFSQMTSQLTQTTKALEKLESVISKFGSNASKSIKQASDETKRLGNNASSSIKKLEGFNTISDAFRNAYNMARKTTQGLVTVFKTAIDYSEQLNLFNVVFQNKMDDMGIKFSEVGLRAEKFQQQLHEAFGTNLLETRKYQALFQSMGENMGIVTDKAEIMSTNLTKLSYDIASLYNAEENDVAQAIRAGVYAGQTKPLRRFGIDVTQVSMQPVLDNLGIDKSISELSQAEKQIIRYMSVLKQASVTHGDFANTIESPANQLKILKQQCAEASIALGNLFLGAFAKMLPYANAILMVIKEIAKAIASFFGIKVEDFNSGIAVGVEEFEGLEDSVGGVGDSASKASKAVKELKRQTLGFDQINNLTTPTPSSGSSGGGGGAGGSAIGGIDQRLLDALKGYENGMEKVRMKANEIRDKIMEWLGFTKEIDPLTGEVSWKFGGIGKTIKNIVKSFLELPIGGKAGVILGLGVAFGFIFKQGTKVLGVLGKSGLAKILAGLLMPTKSLLGYLGNAGLLGIFTKMPNALALNINAWRAELGIIDVATGKIAGLGGALKALGVAFIGFGVSAIGFSTFSNSLKEATLNGDSFKTTAGQVVGALATVAGGMQVGASIAGPYGALIGGLAGAFILLGETMMIQSDKMLKIKEEIKENKKATDDLIGSINESYKAYENGSQTKLNELKTQEALTEKLKQYTDENGKVREGYEEQVKFIMNELRKSYGIEGELIDGRIKDYKNYINQIHNSIEAKRAEIYLKEYEGKLTESIKNEAELYKQMTTNLETLNKATGERHKYEKEIASLESKREKAVEQMKKLADEGKRSSYEYMQLGKSVRDYDSAISHNKVNLDNAIKTEKEAKNVYKETTKAYVEAKNIQQTYSDLSVAIERGNWEEVKKIYSEGSEKTKKDFINSIVAQVQSISKDSDLTKEMITNWQVLATTSKSEYKKALNELPEDTRTIIDNAVKEINGSKTTAWGQAYSLGEGTGKKFKEGAEKSGKATLAVNANTTPASNSFYGFKNSINNQSVTLNANLKFPSADKLKTIAGMTVWANAKGGVFTNGLWKTIKQYASGGVPSHGTMFTAGERGPEVVGHIGSRTEVLNQSQLASVMYEAVTKAISNSNLGNGIEFYAHTDEGVVIDKINRITRQTGQCPLEI